MLQLLKQRFEQNMQRLKGLVWPAVQAALAGRPEALKVLHRMETSGGEPDVIGFDKQAGRNGAQSCYAVCVFRGRLRVPTP
ncbi:MAG: DUF4256 domain-containing protein [Rubrivivax sp.]|nr:DUF4256 domain-containing protein [Rubrivivax sp.]MDP3226251.1 DUF4256 domain-containing protein [Rubrivivax sp.]MDP3613076.1 DUF4256 domain-containing protein [Rubrivivax sp.]